MTLVRTTDQKARPAHFKWALAVCLTATAALSAPLFAQNPSPEAVFDQAMGRSVVGPDRPSSSRPDANQATTSPATEVVGEGKNNFLRRHEDGWFWYEEPPPPPPPKKKPEDVPPAVGQPATPQEAPLSVEWIRNNIDRLRDQAINNPTKENVEMFLYVHKYMMDLSERFAYTYRAVAESNQALDETISNPVTAVSRRQISDATEQAQSKIIQGLADKVGLWYFFQSTCQYCLRQNPILDFLRQDAPLSILPISLDGLPMVDGSHPNWVVDNGQAAELRVSTTPTIFMVRPDTNEVVLLAAGLRSLSELKQRIVEVAYAQKWVSKQEYETAMHGLPRRLLTDGVDLNTLPTGASDAEVLEVMRRGGIHGGGAAAPQTDEGGNTPWRNR